MASHQHPQQPQALSPQESQASPSIYFHYWHPQSASDGGLENYKMSKKKGTSQFDAVAKQSLQGGPSQRLPSGPGDADTPLPDIGTDPTDSLAYLDESQNVFASLLSSPLHVARPGRSSTPVSTFSRHNFPEQLSFPSIHMVPDSMYHIENDIHVEMNTAHRLPTDDVNQNLVQPDTARQLPQTTLRRRPKACRYCRRRKIRCQGYESDPNGKCRNCVRMDQQCIFPLPPPVTPIPTTAFPRGVPPVPLFDKYGRPSINQDRTFQPVSPSSSTVPSFVSASPPDNPFSMFDDVNLAQYNYFNSGDLGRYSPFETSNGNSSPGPGRALSRSSSFGSMDSGASHPPRAERGKKKIVPIRYNDLANGLPKSLVDDVGSLVEIAQPAHRLLNPGNTQQRMHFDSMSSASGHSNGSATDLPGDRYRTSESMGLFSASEKSVPPPTSRTNSGLVPPSQGPLYEPEDVEMGEMAHSRGLNIDDEFLTQSQKRRATSPSHEKLSRFSNSNAYSHLDSGGFSCVKINPNTGKPCNSIFSRPYDLKRHEDFIHNPYKKKIRCDLCTEEKTFSRADALTRHYRVCHPDIEVPGRRPRRRGV